MKIPNEIKEKADKIIFDFNKATFGDSDEYGYVAKYKDGYLYLDRNEGLQISKIARLKYTGNFTNWEFAIFKYSIYDYDPDEWFFWGADEIDGTILGALKAAQKAYPPGWTP